MFPITLVNTFLHVYFNRHEFIFLKNQLLFFTKGLQHADHIFVFLMDIYKVLRLSEQFRRLKPFVYI